MRSIDLNLLVSFEALLRDRNVTRAADRVGLAQPSMSNALARLRKTFGDELFVATSRGMRPTARALELAEPVSEALRQIRLALQDHPFDPTTARRRFTIGATTNANFTLVPPLLEIFGEAPSIDLHIRALTNQQTVQALDAEEIDLAIGVIAELPRRFSVRPLLLDRAVCVARRDHPALNNGLTLELLVALPHVRAALQESPVEAVDVALAYRGLERRFAMIVPNLLLMPIVVARSTMLGILPEKAAKPIADPGRLAVHEIPLDLAPWMLSVICSKRREKDPGVRWLCDRICAKFAEVRTERFAETRPERAAM